MYLRGCFGKTPRLSRGMTGSMTYIDLTSACRNSDGADTDQYGDFSAEIAEKRKQKEKAVVQHQRELHENKNHTDMVTSRGCRKLVREAQAKRDGGSQAPKRAAQEQEPH